MINSIRSQYLCIFIFLEFHNGTQIKRFLEKESGVANCEQLKITGIIELISSVATLSHIQLLYPS